MLAHPARAAGTARPAACRAALKGPRRAAPPGGRPHCPSPGSAPVVSRGSGDSSRTAGSTGPSYRPTRSSRASSSAAGCGRSGPHDPNWPRSSEPVARDRDRGSPPSRWPRGQRPRPSRGRRADRFHQSLAALAAFVEREGHVRVPRSHKEDTVSLGMWLDNTRARREKLSEEQRGQLEALGVAGRPADGEQRRVGIRTAVGERRLSSTIESRKCRQRRCAAGLRSVWRTSGRCRPTGGVRLPVPATRLPAEVS
ncbi:Helicase associated domain protein [Kitasatospora sp. NPDC057542]|uniref:Helicase associated domain protein n=1 Tax=Kitasatospora sp. NPDC057542 TaxID=3346162 RepID=UPI0036A56DB3